MQAIDELKAIVTAAREATTREQLGVLYADLVGYDSAVEDPAATVEDLRDLLIDYVRECCYQYGIHVSRVGL